MLDVTHSTYVQTSVNALRQLCAQEEATSQRVVQLQDQILVLSMLDLEPARHILQAGYCPRLLGKKHRDPVCMFRCIILMTLCSIYSFNKWSDQLKGHPEFVILSGFSKNDCPGVGTFYDFANRLLDGPYQKVCEHHQRPSSRFKRTRGSFRRNLPREKELRNDLAETQMAEKSETRVQNLVRLALSKVESGLPTDFLNRIEELLMLCAVVPSAETGLLGDLSNLTVSGDGSAISSQASGNGKSLCNCREQGVYECDCPRTYSDPQATWGWDSYRERYYFGYRLHLLQTYVDGVDLPLHIMMEGAHTPDVVMGVEAVSRFQKLKQKHLPQAHIKHLLFDAGYDATDFYRLLQHYKVIPIIPLANKSKTPFDLNNLARDQNGTPLCAGNIPMRRMGCNNQRGHVTYCCPAKCIGRKYRKELERCPLGTWCEPDSQMGPLVYLPFDENPRLNTQITRGSEQFKELYKERSGCERFFSKLETKGLKRRPYRRQHLSLLATLVEAITTHAQLWVKRKYQGEKVKDINELFERMESLIQRE